MSYIRGMLYRIHAITMPFDRKHSQCRNVAHFADLMAFTTNYAPPYSIY